MGLFSLHRLFGITIRESATDGSDFTNPDADYRRLFLGEDGQLHVKDSAGTVTDIGAGAGGGASFGQTVAYPTTFSGDTIDGSSITPFADVSAFDVKEALNSRILHLQTSNASKDNRVRVTLGTTKAAAFDVRTAVAIDFAHWDAKYDTYLEIRLSTSADAQIALARIYGNYDASTPARLWANMRAGGVAVNSGDTEPDFPIGETLTIQAVRDGSNVVRWYYGFGTSPMVMLQMKDGSYTPRSESSRSGTLARVEYSIHTPSGPGASQIYDAFVDYLSSV